MKSRDVNSPSQTVKSLARAVTGKLSPCHTLRVPSPREATPRRPASRGARSRLIRIPGAPGQHPGQGAAGQGGARCLDPVWKSGWAQALSQPAPTGTVQGDGGEGSPGRGETRGPGAGRGEKGEREPGEPGRRAARGDGGAGRGGEAAAEPAPGLQACARRPGGSERPAWRPRRAPAQDPAGASRAAARARRAAAGPGASRYSPSPCRPPPGATAPRGRGATAASPRPRAPAPGRASGRLAPSSLFRGDWDASGTSLAAGLGTGGAKYLAGKGQERGPSLRSARPLRARSMRRARGAHARAGPVPQPAAAWGAGRYLAARGGGREGAARASAARGAGFRVFTGPAALGAPDAPD